MGYEISYLYHPRKEDGGYDTETKEEKLVKVGKPFDETPMEKAAAAIMAQLARRDIWVVDVQVCELVRKDISFKECKDGRGIMLKGKRYSFNESAQMVAEDVVDETLELPPGVQPHELITTQIKPSNLEDLYNPNKPVPTQKALPPPVNQNKVLYRVIFDPPIQYTPEAKRLGLRLTQDNTYSVHMIVPHITGKLEMQKIAITDDTGKVAVVSEKFFSTVGTGLFADKELNFSGSSGRRNERKPKLSFEGESYIDSLDTGSSVQGIPLDDGTLPESLMSMPDIRGR